MKKTNLTKAKGIKINLTIFEAKYIFIFIVNKIRIKSTRNPVAWL